MIVATASLGGETDPRRAPIPAFSRPFTVNIHHSPATSLCPDWLLLKTLRRSQKWELMFKVLNKDTGFHQQSSCSPQAPAWAITVLNAALSASALLPATSCKVSVAGRHKPHSSVKQVGVCKAERTYGALELLSHLWVHAGGLARLRGERMQ